MVLATPSRRLRPSLCRRDRHGFPVSCRQFDSNERIITGNIRLGVSYGYCAHGMIMSAYALLQDNPDPTDQEVRQAISGNICRCTGYVKIIDAVQRAAAQIRGVR